MTIRELLEWSLVESDNNAADILPASRRWNIGSNINNEANGYL